MLNLCKYRRIMYCTMQLKGKAPVHTTYQGIFHEYVVS